MRRYLSVLLLSMVLFAASFGTVFAAPSGNESSLNVSSVSDYKQITLSYQLEGTKKTPDRYVIKRGDQTLAEVTSLQYLDTGLHSDTLYTYTVEAWFKDQKLAASEHTARTNAIPVTEIEVTAAVQPDNTVNVSWDHAEPAFTPTFYKVMSSTEILYEGTAQAFTTAPLNPGTYTIQVEAWYEDELVGLGKQSFTVPEIVVANIETAVNLTTNYSAVVDYHIVNPQMAPDRYVVYLDGAKIYEGMPSDTAIEIPELTPSQTYNVTIEAYNQGRLIGKGECVFTAPHPIDTSYELSYWNPDTNDHSIKLIFGWDQTIQQADRMVVMRGDNTQLESYTVLYDGVPIQSLDDQFSSEPQEYYYLVANYQNNDLVGLGYLRIPNFIYY